MENTESHKNLETEVAGWADAQQGIEELAPKQGGVSVVWENFGNLKKRKKKKRDLKTAVTWDYCLPGKVAGPPEPKTDISNIKNGTTQTCINPNSTKNINN